MEDVLYAEYKEVRAKGKFLKRWLLPWQKAKVVRPMIYEILPTIWSCSAKKKHAA